jgi:hypothetical protein
MRRGPAAAHMATALGRPWLDYNIHKILSAADLTFPNN